MSAYNEEARRQTLIRSMGLALAGIGHCPSCVRPAHPRGASGLPALYGPPALADAPGLGGAGEWAGRSDRYVDDSRSNVSHMAMNNVSSYTLFIASQCMNVFASGHLVTWISGLAKGPACLQRRRNAIDIPGQAKALQRPDQIA